MATATNGGFWGSATSSPQNTLRSKQIGELSHMNIVFNSFSVEKSFHTNRFQLIYKYNVFLSVSLHVASLKRMLNLNAAVAKTSVPAEPVWKVVNAYLCMHSQQ